MNFIEKLTQELDEGLSQKALKEKYSSLYNIYGSLYTFLGDIPTSTSRYQRRWNIFGLYDKSTDTEILPPQYIFQTFGEQNKNNPGYLESKYLGKYCIVGKSLGKEDNCYGGTYHSCAGYNIYLLESKQFLFKKEYEEIEVIDGKENAFFIIKEKDSYYLINKQEQKLTTISGIHGIKYYNKNIELFTLTKEYNSWDADAAYLVQQNKTIQVPKNSHIEQEHYSIDYNGTTYLITSTAIEKSTEKMTTLTDINTGKQTQVETGGNEKPFISHGELYLSSTLKSPINVFKNIRSDNEKISDEIAKKLEQLGITDSDLKYRKEASLSYLDVIPTLNGNELVFDNMLFLDKNKTLSFMYSTITHDFIFIEDYNKLNNTPFEYLHMCKSVEQIFEHIFNWESK